MIDGAIVSIIPPLIAAVFTYIVASKRARIQYAKMISDMQSHAIEQVRISEQKMRDEIWAELEKVRQENAELKDEMKLHRDEVNDLRSQLQAATQLRVTLTEQVHSLERLVETYKTRIIELEKKGTI